MAFLLLEKRPARPRVFRERLHMRDLQDEETVNDYRMPKLIIADLVRQYEESPFSNTTGRSHALDAETEVNVKLSPKNTIFHNLPSNTCLMWPPCCSRELGE